MPGIVQAYGDPGCKNKAKDDCKKKENTQNNSIEEFVFMIPGPTSHKNCDYHKTFRMTVINFYRWYLQNENRISSGLSHENKGKDLIPPFNISWQTLHEYFEVIQKKYPNWINDVEAEPSETSAVTSVSDTLEKESQGANESTPPSAINLSNLAK
jgi:hypothetical protein